jgi:hypothetical protein
LSKAPYDSDPGSEDDLPEKAYGGAVAGWDDTPMAFEEEVLDLVNQRRAAGADCVETGTLDPAGPLTRNPALRWAVRHHPRDAGLLCP